MNVTNNLKLPQYTEEDIFDLQDINKAYDSIDKAYKEVIDFKNEIPKTNATAEVIDARGGKETLGGRLNEFDEQLDKNTKQTSGFVSVKLYEHLVKNGDWYLAIKTALDNHNNVLLPEGTYYISDTLNLTYYQTLKGVGRQLVKLIANFNDKSAITMQGNYVKLQSLTIDRIGAISSNANDIGIQCGNGSVFLGQSIIEDVEIVNQNKGIYASPQTNVYSCSFKDIWINGYKHSAIYLEPYGSTGCIFDNIYTTNWDNWDNKTKHNALFGMFLKNYSECCIRQLNIEHCNLNNALYLNSCDTVQIETIHIEGYEQRGEYNGVICVDTSNVNINTVTLVYSSTEVDRNTLRSANIDWNIFKVNNGSVYCNTVFNRNNYNLMGINGTIIQNGTTALAYNVTQSNYKDNVNFTVKNRINKENLFNRLTQFSPKSTERTHQIKEVDGNVYYDINSNMVMNHFKKSIPTTGRWIKGDRITNVNNIYSDYLCVSGGSFPNTTLEGLCTATQWQSQISLTSIKGLNIGDRIQITGSNQTNTITELWEGGAMVEPVVNINANNASIVLLNPIFKGIGLIET